MFCIQIIFIEKLEKVMAFVFIHFASLSKHSALDPAGHSLGAANDI